MINHIGNDKILVKPYPRFPSRYGLENKLKLIPPFIPANVLLSQFDVFIGYSTTLLSEAENEGLIGISLLNYLIPESEMRKKIIQNI